jgi:hypothetical protein
MHVASVVSVALALQLVVVEPGAAQGGGFVPGTRELFSVDFAAEPLGEFPRRLKLLQGNMEMVMKDGIPMLKASDRAAFLINLPEVLPQDFTLEFDIVPKSCCQPEDLAFEGTPAISQSAHSMNFMWHHNSVRAVGGGESMDMPMPPDLAETLPAQLTEVRVVFQGPTFQLYTNGRPVATWSNRKFARGRVLRVFLGGQDDKDRAVYLSKLRIAAR